MLNRVLVLTLWLALATLVPVDQATAIPFQGNLTIDIFDDLLVIPANGAGEATRDATTGVFNLPAGVFGVTDFGGDFGLGRPLKSLRSSRVSGPTTAPRPAALRLAPMERWVA
jgi:hypothetical protein